MRDFRIEEIRFCIRCGTKLRKWGHDFVCPNCLLVHEPNNLGLPTNIEFWQLNEEDYRKEVMQPSRRNDVGKKFDNSSKTKSL